ncbi:MAG: porin family protein [Proteobacteria bacterium]|nr:porin family protein [Pseudomonadota bacterium]
MMSKFAKAAIFGLLATGAAQAADLGTRKPAAPVVPMMAAYNWTGFYVGVQGGYGWGSNKHSNGAVTSGTINNKGGLVGATIGYNYQLSNGLVLGAEADYAWSSLKGSTDLNCVAPGCRTDIRSFGTVRGRLGYAIDRFMPYITGGLAMGDVKGSAGAVTGSSFRAGWTIGAGAEAAITRNITVKGEYLYYDLGKYTYGAGINTTTKGHIVRAGLNYKF